MGKAKKSLKGTTVPSTSHAPLMKGGKISLKLKTRVSGKAGSEFTSRSDENVSTPSLTGLSLLHHSLPAGKPTLPRLAWLNPTAQHTHLEILASSHLHTNQCYTVLPFQNLHVLERVKWTLKRSSTLKISQERTIPSGKQKAHGKAIPSIKENKQL